MTVHVFVAVPNGLVAVRVVRAGTVGTGGFDARHGRDGGRPRVVVRWAWVARRERVAWFRGRRAFLYGLAATLAALLAPAVFGRGGTRVVVWLVYVCFFIVATSCFYGFNISL